MNYTKDQIAAICKAYGLLLKGLPEGVDGPRLMFAISGAESGFGANCTPRHEPAYDHGGYYGEHSTIEKDLIELYGSDAAYSYGPWQVMLVNAPGFSPAELKNDITAAATSFVGFMNRYVLGFRKAQTVQQIAETYNSGHFSANPAPRVLKYAQGVMQYYSSAAL